MLYQDALIVDYGPNFAGQALKTDKGIVCVIPRQLHPRTAASTAMRELVEGLGGNCGECRNCPVGSYG
ncbi:hypothetical protein ACFWRZ_07735 [Streptomyces rubiginosohelvolus]|uniref:hypothetical protein n=1 Tax=Streptomyces rubiginosohelvolus TaxID=67362 RepID=UPI003659211F